MRRAIAIVVLALGVGSAAFGSDKAERLYSRGLVEFHAGRFPQALELLNQAVSADPADPYARYYRGATQGRLGDYAAATADLEEALRLKPDLSVAALDLGVTRTQTGDYAGAIAPLEQARHDPDLEAKASLFLGLSYLRLGKLEEARESFSRAARDPDLRVSADYYLGVVAYQQREWDEAQKRFSDVVAVNPRSDMGVEATAFLDRLKQGPDKIYHLFGGSSLQYDSNVQLAPGDDTIKQVQGLEGHDDDGRFTIAAGAAVTPLSNENLNLTLGYEFFQSLHFDLTRFNIQNHRAEMQLATGWGLFRTGLLARYDFFARKEKIRKFLHQGTMIPWVAFDEGVGRTEVYYRFRVRDFVDDDFEIRDGQNQAAGARQFFYLGSTERYVSAGYQFDRDSPDSFGGPVDPDVFAYDGQEFNAGGGVTLPWEVRTDVGYAYRHERYPSGSRLNLPPNAGGRLDKVHHIVLVLRRPIGEYLQIVAGYFATFNGSNDSNFDYDRHIGSIGFEASF